MLNTLLSHLCVLIYLFLTIDVCCRCYYQSYYTEEEIKVRDYLFLITIAK